MKRLLTLAFIAAATPAFAAVTVRGTNPEEGPRVGWFERYTEMRQGPEQIDKVTQSIKVGDGAGIDLSHLSGDIRVTGIAGSEIKIEATKRVRHRDAEQARRLLQDLRVDINNYNGRVEVRTIYPRRGQYGNNVSASVDYVIGVPAATTVALKSISGDISVTNVKGEVRAETVSGDVNVSNSPNVTIAKTISGDVTAQNVGTLSTLSMSTVSGTVLGTGLKVRALEAGSVSGNVRLVGSDIERLDAKSVSGGIEFDAPLTKGGRYEFISHSGNIRIVLSGNTGFELDADTFAGNVRSDVPVTLRSMGRQEGTATTTVSRNGRTVTVTRPPSSRAVRGSYGDASAFLSIRSHSGSVVITKK